MCPLMAVSLALRLKLQLLDFKKLNIVVVDRQGDHEKQLGLEFSPLCDRKNVNVNIQHRIFIIQAVEYS